MGFNDYSKKQNDQLPAGVNLVSEKRKRVEAQLEERLEHIKTLGYKRELFVDYFKIDFENRHIDIGLKYCEEFDDFIRYDNYDDLSDGDKKTVDACVKYESEIIETTKKILKDLELVYWQPSVGRSGIINKSW